MIRSGSPASCSQHPQGAADTSAKPEAAVPSAFFTHSGTFLVNIDWGTQSPSFQALFPGRSSVFPCYSMMKLAVGRVVRQDGCLQNKAIRQRWEALCEQSSSGLSAPASMLESPELLIPSTTDRKGIISSAIHKSFAIFGG